MAVPKVVGLETEYGITVSGAPEWNPVSASSALINSYATSLTHQPHRVTWDFADESPGNDARESRIPRDQSPPLVETHLVNTVLTNGSRFYVDHAHPELSTPECRDALSLLKYDRAGDLILIDAMAAVDQAFAGETQTVIYKDNSDRKGNAYGCHENYLIDRSFPFGKLVQAATWHFISRQIFTGSGKVGSELAGGPSVDYQITQRADHFENEVGLETTLKRPIVNTRDEPHSDNAKYRRFHVIVGDANVCQVATLLKVGTSAIVFAMAEDGVFEPSTSIADPVRALQAVSRDVSLSEPLELTDGRKMRPIEMQWNLLELAGQWADRHGTEAVGVECAKVVMERWEEVLTALEADPMSLVGKLDWVTKKYLIDGYADRHNCAPGDSRLSALDLQYHDLRPSKSLAAKAGLEKVVSDDDARAAMFDPPADTRAFFRGKVLSKFGESVVAANWDSVVFDTGEESLQRVPMAEPTRGTEEMVGQLIDECETVSELVTRLQG